jgi:hypothetical protein
LLAIDVGVEETENELDYIGVRLGGGQMSRYLVNVQFDFSPETSATFRLAICTLQHVHCAEIVRQQARE